jgi:hypothetical protein
LVTAPNRQLSLAGIVARDTDGDVMKWTWHLVSSPVDKLPSLSLPGLNTAWDTSTKETAATYYAPVFSATFPGVYVMRLEATDGCNVVTHDVVITVRPCGTHRAIRKQGIYKYWQVGVADPSEYGTDAELTHSSVPTAAARTDFDTLKAGPFDYANEGVSEHANAVTANYVERQYDQVAHQKTDHGGGTRLVAKLASPHVYRLGETVPLRGAFNVSDYHRDLISSVETSKTFRWSIQPAAPVLTIAPPATSNSARTHTSATAAAGPVTGSYSVFHFRLGDSVQLTDNEVTYGDYWPTRVYGVRDRWVSTPNEPVLTWRVTARPTGSAAVPTLAATGFPTCAGAAVGTSGTRCTGTLFTMTPDRPGQYDVELTVVDGCARVVRTVQIAVSCNLPPVGSVTSLHKQVVLNQVSTGATYSLAGTVTLDGSLSLDPELVAAPARTYSWSFLSSSQLRGMVGSEPTPASAAAVQPAVGVAVGALPAITGATTATASFTVNRLGTYFVQLVVADGCTEVDGTVNQDVKETSVEVLCPARPLVTFTGVVETTVRNAAISLDARTHVATVSFAEGQTLPSAASPYSLKLQGAATLYQDLTGSVVNTAATVGWSIEVVSGNSPGLLDNIEASTVAAAAGSARAFESPLTIKSKGQYVVRVKATDGCSVGESDWSLVVTDSQGLACPTCPTCTGVANVEKQDVDFTNTVALGNLCEWKSVRAGFIQAVAELAFAAEIAAGTMTIDQAGSKISLTREPEVAVCTRRRRRRLLTTNYEVSYTVAAAPGQGDAVKNAVTTASANGQLLTKTNDINREAAVRAATTPIVLPTNAISATTATVQPAATGCPAESACATKLEQFGLCLSLFEPTVSSRDTYLDYICSDKVAVAKCSSPETECLARCAPQSEVVKLRCESKTYNLTDDCLQTVCGNVPASCSSQSAQGRSAVSQLPALRDEILQLTNSNKDLEDKKLLCTKELTDCNRAFDARVLALQNENDQLTTLVLAQNDTIAQLHKDCDVRVNSRVTTGAFWAVTGVMILFIILTCVLAYVVVSGGGGKSSSGSAGKGSDSATRDVEMTGV